jgi:hypothetical protein
MAELDLVEIVMQLYGPVFDGVGAGVDFQLFSKKPCQVIFFKTKNNFIFMD